LQSELISDKPRRHALAARGESPYWLFQPVTDI
jgi:hypothetical protein